MEYYKIIQLIKERYPDLNLNAINLIRIYYNLYFYIIKHLSISLLKKNKDDNLRKIIEDIISNIQITEQINDNPVQRSESKIKRESVLHERISKSKLFTDENGNINIGEKNVLFYILSNYYKLENINFLINIKEKLDKEVYNDLIEHILYENDISVENLEKLIITNNDILNKKINDRISNKKKEKEEGETNPDEMKYIHKYNNFAIANDIKKLINNLFCVNKKNDYLKDNFDNLETLEKFLNGKKKDYKQIYKMLFSIYSLNKMKDFSNIENRLYFINNNYSYNNFYSIKQIITNHLVRKNKYDSYKQYINPISDRLWFNLAFILNDLSVEIFTKIANLKKIDSIFNKKIRIFF